MLSTMKTALTRNAADAPAKVNTPAAMMGPRVEPRPVQSSRRAITAPCPLVTEPSMMTIAAFVAHTVPMPIAKRAERSRPTVAHARSAAAAPSGGATAMSTALMSMIVRPTPRSGASPACCIASRTGGPPTSWPKLKADTISPMATPVPSTSNGARACGMMAMATPVLPTAAKPMPHSTATTSKRAFQLPSFIVGCREGCRVGRSRRSRQPRERACTRSVAV
mmetsp:Transcript_21273/g.54839  ORF Transcript_21273/g.54839 Transcript_21273/m.54839 type:complete len:222 (-) Transcript_21273:171-836(-)